jgi:uncharacterized SAM-binding protein YcdF (DUF218 family)
MSKELENEFKGLRPEARVPDGKPIEPEKRKWSRTSLLKWLFFLFAIVYVLLSYYHNPLLVHLGRYLIVQHKPQKSDLIVCLAGGNVDRGLAVADAYQKGLAPKIFMAREEPPDGYSLLRERGVNYPDSVDLFRMLLEGMGVPRSAFFTSDRFAKSTFEEAKVVREFVDKGDYRSLIVITSPTHSRRAWLSLRKVFKKKDVRILILPSPYSEFRPEDWWKKRRFLREVIIEYEKLIYYTFKYLW